MRKFDYRVPRFAVDLPVRLTIDNATQVARCREISTGGMKLELDQPLPPDSCAEMRVNFRDISLELSVRAAHASPAGDGVRFVYESDEQRDKVAKLVGLLASAGQRQPGPVLLS